MVDYSKWKNIEISDDEDDTHPNIDTPSLFRWRHQARVERMESTQKETEQFEQAKILNAKRLSELKAKLSQAEQKGTSDLPELQKALQEVTFEAELLSKKEDDLKKKEKSTPWNVDTISKSGFTKTVINKKAIRSQDEDLTDEQREENMKIFIKENKKKLEQFGMLRRFDDSKKFLQENPQLVCENTANYLVLWCINLEMEEKHNLMEHVAHQTICMQYILELSKQLDVDPRACVPSFFTRIQVAEVEYKTSFEDELRQFKIRIRNRAKEKLAEALAEAEEEEKQARLGPGGLDPVEVFDSLPEELKKCFEAQDIPLLQETIAKLPETEACYHMKRCVDSGLWVPEANKNKTEQKEKPTEEVETENVEEIKE